MLGGRYRIDERLGEGGQGEVFAGHDSWLDRPVALKQVPLQEAAALRREFELLREVRHPALVEALDLVFEDDRATLVETRVEGESLEAWARWQNPREVLRVLSPVAHALAHMHVRGVVHGDVSPGNILVDHSGCAVLIDLGFSSRRGASGSVAGTPGFIAPERSREGAKLEPSADVWSLGAVITACLTGDRGADTQRVEPDTFRAFVEECLREAPASRPSASQVAARAAELSGQTVPVLQLPLLRLPLVGRERELDRIHAHEGPKPVWICGPRGSGKTALLERWVSDVCAEGLRVVTVSARDRDADLSLATRLAASARSRTPELELALDPAAPPYERAQALLLFADRLANDQRVAFAVDDMDAPAPFFAELADLLERRQVERGVRVVFAAVGELGPRDGVELQPLDRDALGRLVATAFASVQPAAADAIYEIAGGLPAGAMELLRISRESATPVEAIDPGRLADLSSTSVPDVLAPVFVSEGVLPANVLAELVREDPRALLLAEREGWLQAVSGGFRVPRAIREAWQLDDPRPAHRALAEAYEQAGLPAEAAVAYAGAGEHSHWMRLLAQVGEPARRRKTLERIVASAGFEVLDDEALFSFGEELAEAGEAAGAYAVAERLAARGKETESRVVRGHAAVKVGRYPDALGALESVARRSKDQAALVRALYFAGRSSEALARVEEIENELAGDALARALDIAGHASFALGDPQGGITWLERAHEAAKATDDAKTVARASHSLAIALHRSGDLDRAHELYAASLEVADPLALTTRTLNYATLLHDRGRYEEALDRYRVALARAEQLANLRELARAGVNLANVLTLLGELAEARERAEATARLCVQQGLVHAEVMANLVVAETAIEGERFEAARDRLEAVRRGLSQINDALATVEADLLEARLLLREGAAALAQNKLRDLEVPATGNLPARHALERAYAAVSDPTGEDAVGLTEVVLGQVDVLGDEGRWRALTLHGLALERANDARALPVYEEAAATLDRFLSSLSERYRDAYCSTKSRRTLRAALSKSRSVRPQSQLMAAPAPGLERTYRRLLGLNRQLAREADPDVLLERIVDAAIELLGAERGFILLDADDGVQIAVARNLDRRSLEGGALRFSRSIANDVFRTGEAVVTTNAQNDARYASARSVASSQIRSALCVPLRGIARDEDPLIGALYLDHRYQDRAFTTTDVELCASFADQVTIALENARLVSRVRAQEQSLEQKNRTLEELNRSLKRDAAQAAEAAEAAMRRLREEGPTLGVGRGLEGIVGRSDALRQALRFVDRFADTKVPVAVLGESGTGKELIARALHERSDRADAAFVTVNCGAIPEALIESELFGHVKGAFTGAHRDRPGLFAAAAGGTLFLDEIAEMALPMQVKLLRVLQENEYRPVGGTETVKSSARIVAATHRDLQARVREGSFREDLFYRLNVVEIRVPPLRERREDIPLLVEHFCQQLTGQPAADMFDVEALNRFFAHDWPGNVRELQNEVHRALALSDGRVTVEDLSERLQAVRVSRSQSAASHARGSLKEIMDSFEKEVLLLALERTGWNVRQTAKELGLSRAALYTRMSKFEITREQYAGDPEQTH